MQDVLDVLRVGPGINPKPDCRTRENEARLGLAPSVYAYVGRTVPAFGDAAFALPLNALDGHMSPFDTGGLVDHIAPVSGWSDEDKQKYLQTYTWDTRNRRALLTKYPTSTPAKVRAYLNGERPPHDGPHNLWPKSVVATIWKTTDASWRAWTWEGRVPKKMKLSAPLTAWSCTPALYERICAHAEDSTDGGEQVFLDDLLPRYVRGGVSRMVAELREGQAA